MFDVYYGKGRMKEQKYNLTCQKMFGIFWVFLFIDEKRCVTIVVFAISHHIALKDTAGMIA